MALEFHWRLNIAQFKKAAKEAVKDAKSISKTIVSGNEKALKSINRVAGGALKMGAAVAGALGGISFGLAIKEATEFDKKFTEVLTLLGNTDPQKAFGKSLDEVKKEILALSGGLGDATELTNAMYQAISAGQKPAQALRFVADSAKLATAGVTDTFQAVDLMTTALNAYSLTSDNAAEAQANFDRVSDVLFKTVEKGKTTMDELAANLGKVIPTADAAKVPIEDLGAAIATLTASGIRTEMATTAMNSLFNTLTNQADKFRKAGVDIMKVMEEEGLGGALRRIQELTNGNNEAIKKLIPEAEAYKAVLSLLKGEGAVYADNLEAMKNATGATDAAFEKMSKTTAFLHKELKNKLNAILISVGQELNVAFAPALIKTGEKLKEFLETGQAEKWGKALGEVLSKTVDFLIKYGDTIVTTLKVAAAFWATMQIISWGNAVYSTVTVAIANIAKMSAAMNTAAGTTSLLNTTMGSLGTSMGLAATSAGVLGAAVLGWQIGKKIDDWLGLRDAIDAVYDAELRAIRLKGTVAKTEEIGKFERRMDVIIRDIGITIEELNVHQRTFNRLTEEQQRSVQYLVGTGKNFVDVLQKVSKESKKTVKVNEEVGDSFEDNIPVIDEAAEAFKKLVEAYVTSANLITQTQLDREWAAITVAMKKFGDVGDDVLLKRFGPAIKKLVENAEALGLTVPPVFENLAEKIEALKVADEAKEAIDALLKSLGVMSQEDFDKEFGELVGAMGEMWERGIESGEAFDALNKRIAELRDTAKASNVILTDSQKAWLEMGAAAHTAGTETEELRKAIESLLGNTTELTTEQEALLKVLGDSTVQGEQYETIVRNNAEIMRALAANMDLTEEQARALNAALADLADIEFGDKLTAELESLRTAIGAPGSTGAFELSGTAMLQELDRLSQMTGPQAEAALAALNAKAADWVAEAKRMGIEVPPALEKAFRAKQLDDFAKSFGDMVSSIGQSGGSLISILGNIGLGAMQAFGEGWKKGMSFDDIFKGIKKGLLGEKEDGFFGIGMSGGDAFGAGFGSFMNALGDRTKSWGNKIGTGIGSGIGGYFAGPLGAALGGKVGGWIGGLFDKPAWKKVQKDIQRDLGEAISQGTAQAIADLAKELDVGRDIAELLALDQIAQDADISAANLGKFTNQFAELMKVAASGGKGAEEALDAIGPAFNTLISKAREAEATGTAAFGALIANAKQMADQVPEIAAFIEESVNSAADGLSKLFQSVRLEGELAGESLENLGAISADVFAAMKSLPGGVRAAIEALGPGLDAIVQKAKEAGEELPKAIRQMVAERNWIEKNQDLYDSLDAVVQITKGLGEAGFWSATGFEAMQDEVGILYDQLIDAGRAPRKALEDMAPVLQEIINESQRNGKVIDETTQGLIDQAAALGLVKQEGTDMFAMMRQESNYMLEGMAVIFGKEGAISKYIQETSTVAVDSWRQTKEQIDVINHGAEGLVESHALAANRTIEQWQLAGEGSKNATQQMVDGMKIAIDELSDNTDKASKALAKAMQGVVDDVEGGAMGAFGSVSKFADKLVEKLIALRAQRDDLEDEAKGKGKQGPQRQTGGPLRKTGWFYGHEDEFVIKAQAAKDLGSQILWSINQGGMSALSNMSAFAGDYASKIEAGRASRPREAVVAGVPSNGAGGGAAASGPTVVHIASLQIPLKSITVQWEDGTTMKGKVIDWTAEGIDDGFITMPEGNLR